MPEDVKENLLDPKVAKKQEGRSFQRSIRLKARKQKEEEVNLDGEELHKP